MTFTINIWKWGMVFYFLESSSLVPVEVGAIFVLSGYGPKRGFRLRYGTGRDSDKPGRVWTFRKWRRRV